MPVQVDPFLSYETDYFDKQLVMTGEQFQNMLNFLSTRKALVYDFETSGLAYYKHAEACGVGFAGWDDRGQLWCYYVPFRHRTGERQLDLQIIEPAIKGLIEDQYVMKIAHNIKFEDHIGRREGWKLQGPRYCTMIAARLYDENRLVNLETRAKQDLGRFDADVWKFRLETKVKELAKQHKMPFTAYRDQYGYSQVDIPLCGTYCCFDLDHCGNLHALYENQGLSQRYSRIWNTEMALTEVICDMEQRGVKINVEYLETLRDSLKGVRAGLADQAFHQLGGFTFNIGSDNELRDVLQNRLNIRLYKMTKSKKNYSVDVEVLDELVDEHPVVKTISEWRKAEKLYSTYTTSILERLDSQNVLHTDLQQVGTNTGRLSCKNPNLQNQPTDDDDRALKFSGKSLEDGGVDPWSIRRAYINRDPQFVRLFFDYSQIELRVLAFYSRDPILVQAYLSGEDIHDRTSLEVFETKEKAKRRMAKVINFGLTYCMTPMGFARQVRIPLNEAERHFEKFFERYAGIKSFRNEFWGMVRMQKGYFQNLFGRPRLVHNIAHPEDFRRERAERQAIATLVQGTAAELTKESLVRISKYLKAYDLPAYLELTVHDDIQLSSHVSCLAPVAKEVKRQMEYFPEFDPIPIVVDAEYSLTSWADKKELLI